MAEDNSLKEFGFGLLYFVGTFVWAIPCALVSLPFHLIGKYCNISCGDQCNQYMKGFGDYCLNSPGMFTGQCLDHWKCVNWRPDVYVKAKEEARAKAAMRAAGINV